MKNQYSWGKRFSSGVLQFMLLLMYFYGQNLSIPYAQAENNENEKAKLDETVKEQTNTNHTKRYVPNEVLVRYAKIGALGKITNRHSNLSKIKDIKSQKAGLLSVKDKKDIKEVIQDLKNDPDVIYAQPNYQYKLADLGVNDAFENDLWGMDNTGQEVNDVNGTDDADIDIPEAWAISTGSPVVVAVIDTGVAYDHPDLIDNMWEGSSCVDENGTALGDCINGYDFENNDKNPSPVDSSFGLSEASHGTHVAGTIAAVPNNGKGIAGVAPQSRIMALKSSLTTDEVIRAIAFAEHNGAKVINMSWGSYDFDPLIEEAISDFDGIAVTGAGNDARDNDGEDEGFYPCSSQLDNVICVAATDQSDHLADFSNYGTNSVDISAPGVNILSTIADEIVHTENFNSATPPEIPSGFTKIGNPGTVASGSEIGLIGDVSQYPYSDNADNVVTSPEIDISGKSLAKIDFDTTCDTEYSEIDWTDYMKLRVSKDGSFYDDVIQWDEYIINGDADESGSATWSLNGLELPSDQLDSSNFHYAFEWISNDTDNNHAGCSVDNVVLKVIGSGSGEQYAFMDGTSMATPMVVGAVALAWGYNPNLDKSDVIPAVINHGDEIPELEGIILSGMRLNAANTLSYISTTKSITGFNVEIDGVTYYGSINQNDHTIEIALPSESDLSELSPDIIQTGKSVSPASGVSQDFSNPVTYTVTAMDDSTQDYLVTARHLSTEKAITEFSFASPHVVGVVNETDHTISVEVPFGTNVTSLTPTIIYVGKNITPGSDVAKDFTDPVVYTVEAEDGSSQDYTVTVTSKSDPFSKTSVSTGGTSSGKTDKTKVKLKFSNIENAKYYKVSKNSSFSGAEWKPIKDGITVTLKKKNGKQKFYVKFLSEDGVESSVYTKTVRYEEKSKRKIKNSPSKVERGGMLVESGKRFSKNSNVKLFFSKYGGGYYDPLVVKTDSKGSFSITYVVPQNKPAGTYSWYAVDEKTGKRSKIATYKIK